MKKLKGKLKGIVAKGIGDFSVKMETIPGLLEAYEKKLGIKLFPGTLNIQLEEEYSFPKDRMRLEKEEYGGRVSVNILPCKIFNRKAYILRTDKNELGEGNHPKNIIELACDVKLRDTYNLNDGDKVEIQVI